MVDIGVTRRIFRTILVTSTILCAAQANAQTVEDLQRQINELKAQIKALTEMRAASAPAAPAPAALEPVVSAQVAAASPSSASASTDVADTVAIATNVSAPQPAAVKGTPPRTAEPWYDRLLLRGYTQLRYNALLSGDRTAPDGQARLRSPHDSSINDDGGFSLRRVRLVLQGRITDDVSLYLQQDLGTAVNNQSSTERREHFGQLRDAYVDWFLDKGHSFRLRFGQSKVPFGWENLQSSSNRITLDRSDAINSAAPGERDLGVVAYYTPPRVQVIWDRLAENGQKLFGNYGAFGIAAYNGQGVNRTERNGSLMKVAMGTWPLELDGLGDAFRGQVLELGGAAMLNRIRPEVRSGGVSDRDFDDNRVALHAILYPQPFGIQTEWTWGRGPQFDAASGAIEDKSLSGGYVQLNYDVGKTPVGRILPYGRWQRYRGGWKASVNAPRLETDEIELGVEWRFKDALELTVAYANMKRREADERRIGRAEGNLIRTQLQWTY
ncbi:porin [Sphingomonas sp.]|uniref:porin n=1 Tax=Sphingomonas sp. TaxID=28214 RepID=UPI003B3B6960